MDKEYLTTFEAATLIAVSPDAVLKWIKSGKLEAYRTPGGHYRIAKQDIMNIINKGEKVALPNSEYSEIDGQYCWEFNGNKNCHAVRCEDCLVFKARAKNCFELSYIPVAYGHLRRLCESSCETCGYYHLIKSSN